MDSVTEKCALKQPAHGEHWSWPGSFSLKIAQRWGQAAENGSLFSDLDVRWRGSLWEDDNDA